MSNRVVVVTSELVGAGKTHFAGGVARWLTAAGWHVGPLHLSARTGDAVECPGGRVSRAAALLAECCRLTPALEYETGWGSLGDLLRGHDVVVVEAAAGSAIPEGLTTLRIERVDERLRINGRGRLRLFEEDLMPGADPELESLPVWRLRGGPRAGVISLPHISDFGAYRLLRGAEWMTSIAAGQFGVLFVPASSNHGSDGEWLEQKGLKEWMEGQAAGGARVVVSGWPRKMGFAEGATRLEPGELADYRVLSRVLGRRMAAPLPEEETLERLGKWAGRWRGMAELVSSLS
jgi:hypothetical protein